MPEALCEDEGCPHHGTPHVCVSKPMQYRCASCGYVGERGPSHNMPHAPVTCASRAERVKATITVCSACLQASCWQGEFYCDEARSAGTVEKTRKELEALALEHPDYWKS